MKRTLSMLLSGLLIAPISGYTQGPEDAQRLATGLITKIDAKKKILTVRPSTNDETSRDSRRPQNSGQRGSRGGGTGGRRGGRGGRGGGMGIPFPGGSGGGRGPTSSSKDQPKEFKVTVTDKTAIKDNVTTISFNLLRVGDRISVQGLPKGKGADLEATQITVNQ